MTLLADPAHLKQWTGTIDNIHEVPGVIEFVTSPDYLDRPNLYPRQATILKTIFLQIEDMTDYDHAVLDEWEQSYIESADDKGEGNRGIVPGVRDRIEVLRRCPCGHDKSWHAGKPNDNPVLRFHYLGCVYEDCHCTEYRGRRWFREVVAVIGRRGSKGHMGALAGAYILWHYIQRGDPQEFYGVDRDKRLSAIVFAGKKEQAKANQWRDLYNVILGAPCFSPYIARPQAESLTIKAKADFRKDFDRSIKGVTVGADTSTFEILPKESTLIAGRGAAGFMQFYDEAAHVVKGVANTPAEEVYEAATPALDQFGIDGFIYIPSSPWQRIGLLYDKYQQAIERDEETGEAAYPTRVMLQLTSWDPYEDWEMAHQIEMWPGGPNFKPLQGAIQEYDDEMRALERANPETFAVERRSRFAAVMDAYLNPDRIATMWQPWPTEKDTLYIKEKGSLRTTYRAHGDPSKSGANFGFAIGHVGGRDERGLPHVVFDVIHHWDPADFDDHQIDYDQIGTEIEGYLDGFMPGELTFDQFNSVATIQRLQKYATKRNYPKRVSVYERPATGPLNWKTYETFKTALGLGLIHAPYHEQADLELTFLQDKGGKVEAPDAGPVQTKDVADCLAIVVYELIGEEMLAFIGQSLSDLPLSTKAQGGMDAYREARPDPHEQLSNFGGGSRNLPGYMRRRGRR